MVYKIIRLTDLNLEDNRFHFTLNPSDRRLLRSVSEIGVMQPVIVILRQNRPVLIDGWRRVEAARSCGLEQLPVLEIAEKTDDLAVFLLAFFENYGQRPFSLAEKSLAIRKFHDFELHPAEIIGRILPLLELPPERWMFELMLEVSQLEKRFLETIHHRDWKPVAVELLMKFTPAERDWLFSLLEKLTHGQQREVMERLYSLKRKTGKSLDQLAREERLAGLIARVLKGERAAVDDLLTVLRRVSSPLISRLNQAIAEEIRQIGLPERVRLDYDPSLEKRVLRLTLEAAEQGDLKRAVDSLADSLERGYWKRLFQLLGYEGE
ncbi:MAG: ParB/RepB/Spo0J family partition protein [Candidatus Saccharicenans sp.]|nr:ParB/RepB/Spo0J family partition protein [Candidatus Saccharicenans sp.]